MKLRKKNQLKKEQKKLAESTCVNLQNSSHKTNITQYKINQNKLWSSILIKPNVKGWICKKKNK